MIKSSSEREKELNERLERTYNKMGPATRETASFEDRKALKENLEWIQLLTDFVNKHYVSFLPSLVIGGIVRHHASRALFHAAGLGKINLAEQLINNYGANVNYHQGKMKFTPLYRAIIRNRMGMMDMLLRKGAKLTTTKHGDTPQVWACAFRRPYAIPVFHKHGVDLNKPNFTWSWKPDILGWGLVKQYPLAIAFLCNAPKTKQKIIDTGVNLDTPVIYTGLFRKRKTLLQEIENPTPGRRRPSPAVEQVVKKAMANRCLGVALHAIQQEKNHS